MTQPSLGTPLQWLVFLALVLGLLVLDLGVFHRRERRVSLKEALAWSVVWTVLALVFNLWIYLRFGRQPALEFLAGYVIERSLSFDNLFVFVVLFGYFAVRPRLQYRVLFWGILGALVARGVFVALGAALLSRFEWILLLFGVFLVYTGIRILRENETKVDPEANLVLKLFRRFVPLTDGYRGKRFLVREDGRLRATPLLLVLVVVEATDVVFAVDSIPAVFGVTSDPFIVFTSNIFAILGLRALYFLLAELIHRFRFLGYGLGLVLIFVGLKMLTHHYVTLPIELSLGIVVLILAVAIGLSLLLPPKERPYAAETDVEEPDDDEI